MSKDFVGVIENILASYMIIIVYIRLLEELIKQQEVLEVILKEFRSLFHR